MSKISEIPENTNPAIGHYLLGDDTTPSTKRFKIMNLINLFLGFITTDKLTNPYKFSVYLTAAQNVNASASTVINLDSKLYDMGDNFNDTTHMFVAPIDGFYHFSSTVTVNVAAGDIYGVGIQVNGTPVKLGDAKIIYTGPFNQSFPVSGDIQLNAGDEVQVFFENGSASTHGVVAAAASTFFDGHLISGL